MNEVSNPTDVSPLVTDQEEVVIIKRTARVRRREAWVGWTQVMANFLVPITLGFAGWAILADNWRAQSTAAQRQIELFYTPGLGEAQRVLFTLWGDVDLTALSGPQSRAFIDAFVEKSIEASDIDRRDVTSAIVNLASYFDRVENCIDRNRCDETEIVSQLGQYGRDFYCIYSGQIADLRQGSLVVSLGQGAERFANRTGGCKSGAIVK